jgi:Myb-like DNA-binding domain
MAPSNQSHIGDVHSSSNSKRNHPSSSQQQEGDGSCCNSRMTSRFSSRSGRWTPEEKLLFLHGLRLYGRGRWKKIRQFLPTR